MKKFTKLLGIVLIMALVMSMGISSAFAASITINRDDSYETSPTDGQTAAEGNRAYTYYQIFRASYGTDHTAANYNDTYDADTGALTDLNTTLGKGVSYFLYTDATSYPNDAKVISALGGTGNDWFTMTESADGSRQIVSWTDGVATDVATVQAAAKWLAGLASGTGAVYIASGSLVASSDGTKWTSGTIAEGYYVVQGSEGENLIAVTTDVTINEKNSYPTIDKKEKDKDLTAYTDGQRATDGVGDAVKVAVGDEIDYQITVHVPYDVNKPIIVTDKASSGLEFDRANGTLTVTGFTADTDYEVINASYKIDVDGDGAAETEVYDDKATWQIAILPTNNTKGQDVVITFTATVTEDALVDTGRRNDVELKYNNEHYKMTDYVEYTTYFAGIIKVDGSTLGSGDVVTADTVKLEGVKFTLKEKAGSAAAAEFKVSKAKDSSGNELDYYIPDANGSSEVVTDADGLIKIRGLDNDKTYTLTETETKDGFNLLSGDVTLELTEDRGTAFDDADPAKDFKLIKNNKGTVLPSTGGIGTTIFYVVGSILVVAAGVLLITKKRMGRE